MDSRDSSEPKLPARLAPPVRPLALAPARPAATAELPSPLNVRLVTRGLARYWWQVLALWVVGSSVAAWLIFTQVRPSYEAMAMLKVMPDATDLFDVRGRGGLGMVNATMETEVALIKSANILSAAASTPSVQNLPRIRKSLDPAHELRTLLDVNVQPNTHLIQVSVRSPDPYEAHIIVNAVVTAYLGQMRTESETTSKGLIDSLTGYLATLSSQIKQKEQEWLDLANNGKADPLLSGTKNAAGTAVAGADSETTRSFKKILPEDYRELQRQLNSANIELLSAQAILERRQGDPGAAEPAGAGLRTDRQIQDALNADPRLAESMSRYKAADKQFTDMLQKVRKPSDPAVVAANRKMQEAAQRYVELKKSLVDNLRGTIAAQNAVSPDKPLADAQRRYEEALARKVSFEETMSKMEIASRQEASDSVRIVLVQEARAGLREMEASVNKRLDQLKFEAKEGAEDRIRKVHEATIPGAPIRDSRMKLLAAAPLGVLGALLGLVVLLELRAGRVCHPDDLSHRVRAEVFSIPPLPVARNGRDRAELVEEFSQRMDHLRVAICSGNSHHAGGGRCILITSATGGEGKTTLAAQLAGRCASAGLSTLLIDADLRRPMLAKLLDVPEQPGLTDVLAGEVEPEAALVVIGNAGGFHLLPAGAPGHEPGRLLGSPGLGQLVSRLRQTFDVVIIDTPPVLPVPDALQLGRWADGVVLATRHDASRFQFVEQANRMLSTAGIPVLGVVVNGIRTPDSVSGGYAYKYRSERAANA